ncbi:MAG: hypothetical protein JKY17_02565 [Magnetovibrio sp.]|nr:hypothetical protein [Magnetovibrio sp.]
MRDGHQINGRQRAFTRTLRLIYGDEDNAENGAFTSCMLIAAGRERRHRTMRSCPRPWSRKWCCKNLNEI